MKRQNMILALMLIAAVILVSSCAKEPANPPKEGVSVKVVDPNKAGLALIQDLHLETIPQILSVKELIEHRSALHDKTLTVKGIIIEAIVGEKACPSKKIVEGGVDIAGCAQPRIIIADSADAARDKRYDVIVLVKEDDTNYQEGQLVEITGIVSASKVAVVINKKY